MICVRKLALLKCRRHVVNIDPDIQSAVIYYLGSVRNRNLHAVQWVPILIIVSKWLVFGDYYGDVKISITIQVVKRSDLDCNTKNANIKIITLKRKFLFKDLI